MGRWSLGEWLAGLSLTGLILAMLASMLLASLAGHAVRRIEYRRAQLRSEEVEHSQESYLVGSMLGLLALLLAFTFSMALDRFEERRHLVVQEANAIGTAYLRAQLLDEPHRSRLSNLLVNYTDNRIALATASPDRVQSYLRHNDQLLIDIWAAVAGARESALLHGMTTALLMTYNEVIDLDTERKVARQVRVPAPVFLLLYGFLVLTAAVLGYVLEERRGRIHAAVLFVLLSLYVSIIADLNRPASGSIRESQEPMLMLRASLKAQPPAVFDRFRTAAPVEAGR
ncbi:MAG: hypothetical protein ACJ8FC_01165 [Sphingomicrobium sp.]